MVFVMVFGINLGICSFEDIEQSRFCAKFFVYK